MQHLSPMAEVKLAFAQQGIWVPTIAYFFLVAAASAFGLWGLQFPQDILKTDIKGVGGALALIFAIGTIGMAATGWFVDRGGRRENILVGTLAVSALGFALTAATTANPALATAGFVLGVFGCLASFPVFWGSLTPRLMPVAAAGAIAMVNSVGNLGGAIGPSVLGPIKQSLGLAPSIATVAVMMALAAVFALALRPGRARGAA